jgi:thiol-disulfide isomerase/thioredoxin
MGNARKHGGRRFAQGLATLALGALLLVGGVGERSAQAQRGGRDAWTDAFPKEWHFHNKGPAPMAGRKAPELAVGQWHNVGGKPLRELRGKPVVIDFWGTWCPPCRAAAPHFSELAERYKGKAHFMAVCNTKGGDKMAQVANQVGMKVPTAMDRSDQTKRAYGVSLWPYYVFIDSEGVIRAAGIRSDKVEDALKKLIEVEASLGMGGTDSESGGASGLVVKDEWLEDGERPVKRRRLSGIEGKPAPEISVSDWINADAMSMSDLKGKIVVLDFWGTWCDECAESVPTNNALYAKYKERGVEIIGVCHPRRVEKMQEVAEASGIEFPIAADARGATVRAYRSNDTPDYYVIDREGTLVVADVADDKVGEVIEALLELDPEEVVEEKPEDDKEGEAVRVRQRTR